MKKMNLIRKASLCLLLTTVLMSVPCLSFAAGDGSGGGGGAVIPLYMDWSYPADGSSGVSVTPVIQCKFSHNVSQTNVRDRNKTLVTLEKADGTDVDITVFMADSQVQFDKRQFIYVSPVKPLSYGTKYILKLHEGIQAKNNMATDEVQTVTFTTEYGRSSFNTPLVTPPVTNELAGGSAGQSGDGSEDGTGSDGNSEGGESSLSEGNSSDSGAGKQDGAETDADADTSSDDETSAAVGGQSSGGGDGSNDSGGSGENGESSDDAATAGDTGGENGSAADSAESGASDISSAAGEAADAASAGIAAALLLIALAGGAGAAATGFWMKRRNDSARRIIDRQRGTEEPQPSTQPSTWNRRGSRAAAKHMALILAGTIAAGSLLGGLADNSYGAVPSSFTVRVKIGDTVVSEKVYTDAELSAMKQTRQTYSGINEEGLPCVVGAERITLADLTRSQGVDPSEIESISIYGSNNWMRNMIYNYLYGVGRYYYPHLSEAWRMENGGEDEKSAGEEGGTGGAGNADAADGADGASDGTAANNAGNADAGANTGNEGGTVGKSVSVDPAEYRYQDAVKVEPMLALRSVSSQLADEVSWSSLSSIEGYRFCFGQMNPSDGSYLMYGYNLTAIDIKVSAAGEFAESVGMKDTTGKKVMGSGGADSPGSADVEGPYENPFTGETIDRLPNELTVQVGYYGTEYYTIKTFTFDELASMPLVRQAYSAVSSGGTNGIMTAMGVRLVDVITAAGVDVSSVDKIAFSNRTGSSGTGSNGAGGDSSTVTASKAWLIDMNRYYYPNLTSTLNYTTGGSGAARNAVRVDAILALKDYWDESSAVPDFYRLDGTHRYHLIYGQTSAKSDNIGKSLMWIDNIKIQLKGSPSDENWIDEYLGKVIGNGEGNGTGSGGGSGNSASESASDGPAAEAPELEQQEIDSAGGGYEKIDASGKHVYEISGGSVSWSLGSEKKDYSIYIGLAAGIVFLFGAGVSWLSCRYRLRSRRG